MIETCLSRAPAHDICPTEEDLLPQTLALLPPGRAHQTHDGGPWPGSVLHGFWAAVAAMRAWFNARMCDMREEFFCATTDEMRDVWLAQYGLPDDCDPFPDLCEKVAAQGGQRCDYFRTVAAKRGWAIDCVALRDACVRQYGTARYGAVVAATQDFAARFGSHRFGAAKGCPATYVSAGPGYGARDVNTLQIRVYTGASPAYVAPTTRPRRFGSGRLGQFRACQVNSIAPLQCLIERIAPAHALVVYEVI